MDELLHRSGGTAAGDHGADQKLTGSALHPQWTLAACILATSLAFIDGSVTTVALPAIGNELSASAAELQWTVNAYMLPLSALVLFGGAAGDHFGRKRLLIAGTILFALSSLACALAGDLTLLLAGRAVQGIASAMLLPNSLAMIGEAYDGEARGRAIGTWAAAGAIAAAVGPPLGGWLVDSVGWRAIFLINPPVAAVSALLAWRFARESAEREQPLDWLGAALATLALGSLAWGLTAWSSRSAFDAESGLTIAAGVALAIGFVVHQRRLGERAMMPLELFASRAFAGISALTFLVYAALGGLLTLLPYVLIEGGGYSALSAGLALLPLPLVIGAGSRLMGQFAAKAGPRLPLTIGPLVAGCGFALMVRIEPQASYWTNLFPAVVVVALGMAGTAAPLTTAVLASVDRRHSGTASGFNSAIARTGGLIATAMAGAVIAAQGSGVVEAFHTAAIVGAASALLGGAIGWLTLEGLARGEARPGSAAR